VRRVRVLEQAAEEAIEAAAWYEKGRTGLGAEFAQAIDAAIGLLVENIVPLTSLSGAAGARGAKKLVLKRFPTSWYSNATRRFSLLPWPITLVVQDIGGVVCRSKTRRCVRKLA
jgi:hypothetical protein